VRPLLPQQQGKQLWRPLLLLVLVLLHPRLLVVAAGHSPGHAPMKAL
jgi:hypothetical protein